MIRCFTKSRAIYLAGLAVTVLLEVYSIFSQAGGPLWLLYIRMALLAALGTVISYLLANLAATRENQKALELLYVKLAPEDFLRVYQSVPARLKAGSARRVTTAAYLAEGLLLASRYDDALAALEPPAENKNRLPLDCLNSYTRCRILLRKGDLPAAESSLRAYRELLRQAAHENPQLADNLKPDCRSLERELKFAKVGEIDTQKLRTEVKAQQVLPRRMELTLLLAKALQREGKAGEAAPLLRELEERCGGLALGREARALEKL